MDRRISSSSFICPTQVLGGQEMQRSRYIYWRNLWMITTLGGEAALITTTTKKTVLDKVLSVINNTMHPSARPLGLCTWGSNCSEHHSSPLWCASFSSAAGYLPSSCRRPSRSLCLNWLLFATTPHPTPSHASPLENFSFWSSSLSGLIFQKYSCVCIYLLSLFILSGECKYHQGRNGWSSGLYSHHLG